MKKITTLPAIALCIITLAANAQTRTSVQTGFWSVASTWDCNCIPAAGEDVVVAAGHTVTLNGNTTINNVNVNATGILTIGAVAFTSNGTLTIDGTVNITSNTGTKIFNNITVDAGGNWNVTTAVAMTVNGSIQNDATFTSGSGLYTLAGAAKTISGANPVSITQVTITGSYTNNGTFTVVSTFAGAGSLTNSGTGTLNIKSSAVSLSTLTATAAGNTVNYSGSATQTMKSTTYYDLNVASTGGTVFTSSITVNNNFTVSTGTANIGSYNVTVSGTTSISGILTLSGNSGTWSFQDVNVNSGGTIDATSSGTPNTATINGNLNMSGGSITGTSTGTFNVLGNFNILSGANTIGQETITVTGTTDITGTVTFTSISGVKTFGNVNINSGGSWSNSAAETFTVTGNLTMTGGSLDGAATGIITIPGTFNVSSGANTLGNVTFTASAATTISGTLNITSTGGTKTFKDITVNPGGTWNCTVAEDFSVTGNIANDGTFTGNSGIYTLSGAGKTISGASSTAISNVTISGAGSYTNNGVLTVGTALSGAGSLTQGATGTLNLGGTALITTLVATAATNTVNYNGAGAQTLRTTTYYNLSVTKSAGTASVNGAITVNNNLDVAQGTLAIGAYNFTVSGNTSVTGTLNITSNAGVPVFNNITVNSGGTWNSTVTENFTINGSIQNDGTFTSGAGTYTLAGAAKSLSGNNPLSIANAAVSGSYTNNGTLSVTTALTGAGSLTNAGGKTLNIGGSSTITTLTATAAGNTVNYNGSASQLMVQTTYYDLNVTSTGGAVSTGAVTVNNNFTVASGTASNGGYNMTVTGTSSITGTFTISSTAGTKTFGDITVNPGGNWNCTAAEDFTVNGNIQNDGTFTSNSGTYTLAGAGKTLSGANTVTITSASVSGSYTNNGTCTITTTLAGAGSLTNAANKTLNIGASSVTLTTLAASASGNTVNYNRAGAQTIKVPSSTYTNLTISGSGTKSLAGATSITGTLTVSAGTFSVSGQTFTLISDGNGTARIADNTGGGTISGTVVMQRYVAGSACYHMIGSPMTDATILQLDDDVTLQGLVDRHPTQLPSLYYYDESTTGDWANTYVVPAGGTADLMVNGRGYDLYFFQSNLPATVDITGTPKSGAANLNVTYNPTGPGDPVNDGWNLVSNPYPSAIDWDAAWTTKTNVATTFYIWDETISDYRSYQTGVGGNGTRYIASMQAFWIQTTASSPSLTCPESVKSSQDPSFYKNGNGTIANLPDLMRLRVVDNNSPEHFSDAALVRFTKDAKTSYEPEYDSHRLFSPTSLIPNLSTLSTDKLPLTVNTFPALNRGYDIPVALHVGATGSYTISAENLASFPSGTSVTLEDLDNGKITDMTRNSYTFDAASDKERKTRFVLHIGPQQTIPAEAEPIPSDEISINSLDGHININFNYSEAVNSSVSIYDVLGKKVSEVKNISADKNLLSIDLSFAPGGIYLVNVQSGNRALNKKVELKK